MGKFQDKKSYARGIIGNYSVKSFKKSGEDLLSRSYKLKNKLYVEFSSILGKEKASMVMSLCFGEASYLSEEQNAEFKQLGVVHAISVSGFHMALIYKILENIFGIYISMVISFIYVLFTGSQAATLRSFIMIFVMKLSKKFYKKYDSLSSLSFSAILLLVYKPYYVLDLGYILSYLACIGIILYYNKLNKCLFKFSKSIREGVSLSLSAQVFSMPFAALQFKQIAYGFLLGNIILLPLYSAIVIIGNIALLLFKVKPLFSITTFILRVILIANDGATYVLLKFTPAISTVSYIEAISMLIMIFCFILTKHGYKKWAYFPMFLLPVMLLQNFYFFPEVQFYNSGTKECVLIYTGNKSVLLENEEDRAAFKGLEADKIINSKNVNIKLINNCYASTHLLEDNDINSIDLKVTSPDRKIIFTRDTSKYEHLSPNEYDIIKLPKKKYYYKQGTYSKNKLSSVKYKIIFNKVYDISGL
jgi:competence protein ComEC